MMMMMMMVVVVEGGGRGVVVVVVVVVLVVVVVVSPEAGAQQGPMKYSAIVLDIVTVSNMQGKPRLKSLVISSEVLWKLNKQIN